MNVGYARVSTAGQTLDGQVDALLAAGCQRVFEETASGSRSDRPILEEALSFCRESDVLVVQRLDRVARSMTHLISVMGLLEQRQIGFRSLSEQIDTTTAGGRLVFHVMAAMGQFELDLIRERTRFGLDAARRRGRKGGRPPVMTETKLEAARKLMMAGTPARDVAASLGVSLPTLYRHLPARKS